MNKKFKNKFIGFIFSVPVLDLTCLGRFNTQIIRIAYTVLFCA
jgi:hypothetical protein